MSNLARRTKPYPEADKASVTNTPISFSVPYKSRERGGSRHYGFFPFFAKKPWPVVQEYIKHYTSPGDIVCDPFVGSGVTAVEALILGRRAIAGDINPVARFITRMTAVAPVDLDALREAYKHVQSIAQSTIEAIDKMTEEEALALLPSLNYPRNEIPFTVRRAGAETVDQLHTPRQLAGLAVLRDAINEVQDDILRDLLRVALSNTVRYANKMYILPFDKEKRRSPYRGDVSFLRRSSYSFASEKLFYELPIWPTFERVFKNVLEAKEETNQLIGSQYNDRNFILSNMSASQIHDITGENTVDYCFTDPPYSNDIYFVDLSTLWASWLGFNIPNEVRHEELLIDTKQGKSRQLFEEQFAASVESIARSLKNERWFTLVYKHRDLSLWQTIVAACEESGLRYVNSVWQDVVIRSTRQVESPNINPKGDMYLNFRKMSQRRFESIYSHTSVVDLPTRPNYVEHEVERIIVSYLGADIELISASVIQQILDSRAFRDYSENPVGVTEDIANVLKSPSFTTWRLSNGSVHWIISPQIVLDPSLPAVDRARYHIFDLLREKGMTAEGEVVQYVFTRLSEERGYKAVQLDLPSLLRTVAVEIGPHIWQLDEERVASYKQLRLFFWPSKADELRERVERQVAQRDIPALRIDIEGIGSLRDRLRQANMANKDFETQYSHLQDLLKMILWRLRSTFAEQIEQVLAVGDWAREGIDLRNLPFEEVVILIVLRSDKRPFELYRRIAEEIFSDIDDEDVLFQFQLETLSEWNRAIEMTRMRQKEEPLGITLLTRTW